MRKLLIALGGLAAVVILGVAVAAVMIDPIVRRKVESSTSSSLKVPTRLNAASVKFSGKAVLSKFEADNAPGFAEPEAVRFERLEITVPPRQIFKPTVHVDELKLVRPVLTLEFRGARNNLGALLDNLRSGGERDGKKFLIRKLVIESGVVRFRSDLLSGGTRALTLPAIELENVGSASTAEVLRVVLQTLGTAALQAGEGNLPRELIDSLKGDLARHLRELPARTMEELRRKLEDARVREIDPARVERTLRDLLEKKAD